MRTVMELIQHSTRWGPLLEFHGTVNTRDIAMLTESLYKKARNLALEQGYTDFLRIWNVIPRINHFENNIENYQRFCEGRKKAFDSFNFADTQFPAASAVGSKNDEISFKFLLCRKTPKKIGNPHQIEAYRYPFLYGPTPPSFARAAVLDSKFFLSGTASIRGHETVYSGNLLGQLECTLENIQSILSETYKITGLLIEKESMDWRVYLRHPDARLCVQDILFRKLGRQLEFVEADICRSNLMLEIEGFFHGI